MKCPKCESENIIVRVNLCCEMPYEYFGNLDKKKMAKKEFKVLYIEKNATFQCADCREYI